MFGIDLHPQVGFLVKKNHSMRVSCFKETSYGCSYIKSDSSNVHWELSPVSQDLPRGWLVLKTWRYSLKGHSH